jgi:hypothetical protein
LGVASKTDDAIAYERLEPVTDFPEVAPGYHLASSWCRGAEVGSATAASGKSN